MLKNRLVVLSIIIAISLLMIKGLGCFPVLGKLIAKSDLEAYVGDSVSVRYSLYNGHYYGDDSKGREYWYFLDNYTIFDETVDNRIQKQFNEQYQALLNTPPFNTIKMPTYVDVFTRIDANDHSKVYLKLYILYAYEPVHLNEAESRIRMHEILESICNHIDFNVTAIQFGYKNLDGQYQAIFDNGKKPIMESGWILCIKTHSEEDPIPFLPY